MCSITAIIVSHNSEDVLPACLDALREQQDVVVSVIIVDSGSKTTGYLEQYQKNADVQYLDNVGFSQANNHGIARCDPETDWIVFLNPDAYPFENAFSRACQELQSRPDVACLTGKLLGYDVAQATATGRLDSTGIFRKWYGRWYDRGQGLKDQGQWDRKEYIPAACGAFLFCRHSALKNVGLQGGAVFSPDFFLYKEDIEFSLRLRKRGWQILYLPDILVYHCRGWKESRSDIELSQKIMAAKSEILLYLKHPSVYMVWALVKYLLVRVFKV